MRKPESTPVRPLAQPPAQRGFARDVVRLATGTVSAQLLNLLFAPIITREFEPSAFGIFAIYVAITILLESVVCLRYEATIMLCESDDESANALALSVIFAGVVSLVTGFALHISGGWFASVLHVPQLQRYLWLIPLNMLIIGADQAMRTWTVRARSYTRISLSDVVFACVSLATQLSAGLTGHTGAIYLILSVLFGRLAAMLFVAVAALRDSGHLFIHAVRPRAMVAVAGRYVGFAKFGVAAMLLNSVSWQLPSLMLSGFFSVAIVGQYALGTRVIRVPASLIGTNVMQVFFQRGADHRRTGQLGATVESTVATLLKLGLFPSLVLSLVGRDMFVVVFGSRWAEAGVYAQILSCWTCVWLIAIPISRVYDILEKQSTALRINIAVLVTRVASLAIGGYAQNARLALVLFAASGVVVYGYMIIAAVRLGGGSTLRILRQARPQLLHFIPAVAVIGLLRWLHASPVPVTIAAALLICVSLVIVVCSDGVISEWSRQTFARVARRPEPVSAPQPR